MKLTEDLISQLVFKLFGSYKITYNPEGKDKPDAKVIEIDFTPPFKRFSMIETLEQATGEKFPEKLETEEAR
jgi:lysyl-tRNA synthetase class 2